MLDYVQAAAFLDVTVGMLRKMVYAGKISCVRLGHRTVRFRPADLEKCVGRYTLNSVFDHEGGSEGLQGFQKHKSGRRSACARMLAPTKENV